MGESRERIVSLYEADGLGYGCLSKEKYNFDFIPFKMGKLADDEIRVKVLYTGVCQIDILIANGSWQESVDVQQPCVPGHEIVGEVIKKGEMVKEFIIGDVVGFGFYGNNCGNCNYCLNSQEHFCKEAEIVFENNFGGWATHFQGKAKRAVRIPKEIPLEQCPPLLCSGLSLYTPMKKYLKPELKVAIIGIGEVGHLAIMLCKNFGSKTVVFTSSNESVRVLKTLGADEVFSLNFLKEKQKIRDIDVVVCCVAEGPFHEYIRILKKGGTFICTLPFQNEFKADLHYIVFNQIKIEGNFMGSKEDLENCLDFCANNNVFPTVELYNFDDFPKVVHRVHYEKPNYHCVVKSNSIKYQQFNI